MVRVAGGLELDVDRGPNWLFVKIHPSNPPTQEGPQMADELWSISAKHFIYRLVLELDDVDSLPSGMMGQLVMLQERLAQRGGALKLCGLSQDGLRMLHECHLDQALPHHSSRVSAVLGDSKAADSQLTSPEERLAQVGILD